MASKLGKISSQLFVFAIISQLISNETLAATLNSSQINEIIKSLAPQRGMATGTLEVGKSSAGADCFNVYSEKKYDLPDVLFEFNRFDLTENAKKVLDVVGSALNSNQLQKQTYLVAGFTDAIGSFDYNLKLSKQRALAVYGYLVTSARVDASHLAFAGFGETNLRMPTQPASPVNRRVTLVLLNSENPKCNK